MPGLWAIPPLPRLHERLSNDFADVVEDTRGDKTWQVLLVHLKTHAENLPVCPEVAEGAFHYHVAPAQAGDEVLLLAVQLLCVGLHESGLEGVSCVSNDEGIDDNGFNGKIRDPRCIALVLHHLGEQGVAEYVGILGALWITRHTWTVSQAMFLPVLN